MGLEELSRRMSKYYETNEKEIEYTPNKAKIPTFHQGSQSNNPPSVKQPGGTLPRVDVSKKQFGIGFNPNVTKPQPLPYANKVSSFMPQVGTPANVQTDTGYVTQQLPYYNNQLGVAQTYKDKAESLKAQVQEQQKAVRPWQGVSSSMAAATQTQAVPTLPKGVSTMGLPTTTVVKPIQQAVEEQKLANLKGELAQAQNAGYMADYSQQWNALNQRPDAEAIKQQLARMATLKASIGSDQGQNIAAMNEYQRIRASLDKLGINAEGLADWLQRNADVYEAAAEAKEAAEKASKSFGSGVLESAKTVGQVFGAGNGTVASAAQGIMNARTGEYRPINIYGDAFDAVRNRQVVRGTVGENIAYEVAQATGMEGAGKVAKFLYDGMMSGADSTALALLAGGVNAGIATPALGATVGGTATANGLASIVLGSSAASETVMDVVERGGSTEQAITAGMLAGVAEAVFEKISIDSLLDKFKASDLTSFKDAVKNAILQGVTEATEEGATELTNIIADKYVMGSLSNIEQMKQAGMSDAQITGALAKQVGVAALSGLLMGVVGGGAASITNQRLPKFGANGTAAKMAGRLDTMYGGKKAQNPNLQTAKTAPESVLQQEQQTTNEPAEPLRLYHGTANGGNFDSFSEEFLGNSKLSHQLGQGFYFTDNKQEANSYLKNYNAASNSYSAGSNPYLHEVDVKIENPFVMGEMELPLDRMKTVFMEGDNNWFFDSHLPRILGNKEIDGVKRSTEQLKALSKEEKIDLLLSYESKIGDGRGVLQYSLDAYKDQAKLIDSMRRNFGYDAIVDRTNKNTTQYVVFDPSKIAKATAANSPAQPALPYTPNATDWYEKRVDELRESIKDLRRNRRKKVGGYYVGMYTGNGSDGITISITTPDGDKIREFVEGGEYWTNEQLQHEIASRIAEFERRSVSVPDNWRELAQGIREPEFDGDSWSEDYADYNSGIRDRVAIAALRELIRDAETMSPRQLLAKSAASLAEYEQVQANKPYGESYTEAEQVLLTTLYNQHSLYGNAARNPAFVEDIKAIVEEKQGVKPALPYNPNTPKPIPQNPAQGKFGGNTVGAAQPNPGTYANLQTEHGVVAPGENPARMIDMPKKDANGQVNSLFARTVAESESMPNEMVPEWEKAVASGAFSHEVATDKAANRHAERELGKGWDHAMRQWNAVSEGTKIATKNDLALGQLLLANAMKDGDTQTAMKLTAELCAEATRAGQAVQSFRLLKKMTPEGMLYYLQKTVNNLNEDFEGRKGFEKIKIDEGLAERLTKATTREEMDAVVDDIKKDIAAQTPVTWYDKWNAWRYVSMLGNPTTQVRNILGNALFLPVVKTKNLIATGIEAAVKKTGHLPYATKAVLNAKKDKSLLDFADKDFDNVVQEIQGGGKYSDKDDVLSKRQIFRNKFLEGWRTLTNKAMDKGDEIFSHQHYKASLAQYMKANNLTPENITPEQLNKARSYAVQEAQRATYRDASSVASLINRAKRTLANTANNKDNDLSKRAAARAGEFLLEGFVPFTKTPVNIVKRGIEYSPVGLVHGTVNLVRSVRGGDVDAAAAIDRMAAGLTGSGLLALGAWLASLGMVSGGPGEDDREEKYKGMLGGQDYALDLGDSTYTIDWLAPEALPFFTGVELYKEMQSKDGISLADTMGLISAMSDPIVELSMLSSMNNTFESLKYTQGDALSTVAGNLITSYLGQGVPTVGGKIARTLDETSRQTYYDPNKTGIIKSADVFRQKVQAKIPGAANALPERVDLWGRTEKNTGGNIAGRFFYNMLSPGYAEPKNVTKVDEELLRLAETTSDSNVYPEAAAKTFKVSGETIKLNSKQYTQFAKTKGQTAFDILEAAVDSSTYKKMTDAEKAEFVKDVYEYANAKAKAEVSKYQLDGKNAKIAQAEAKGIKPAQFLTITGAYDKDGNGSVTQEEAKEVLDKSGLTKAQKAYLWKLQDKSWKNNPYN